MILATEDTTLNIYALAAAILGDYTVDEACSIFGIGTGRFKSSDKQIKRMVDMHERGYSTKDIGYLFGVSGRAVEGKIYRYKMKLCE